MRKLLWVLNKNFKTAIRNPGLYIAILIGPILFVTLIGLAFQSSSLNSNIVLGVYEEGNSFIFDIFTDIKNVKTQKYYSEQNCKKNVNIHNIHACIVVKEDSEGNEIKKDVKVYFDYSRSSLVLAISDIVRNVLGNIDREISYNTLETIRTELDPNKHDIYGVKNDLNDINKEINHAIGDLENIRNDINKEAQETVEDMDSTKDDLSNVHNKLIGYESDISSNEQRVRYYKQIVGDLRDSMKTINENSKEIWRDYCQYSGTNHYPDITTNDEEYEEIMTDNNPPCSMFATTYYMSNDYHNDLNTLYYDLELTEHSLEQAKNDIQTTKIQITEYENSLENKKVNLRNDQGEINDYIQDKIEDLDDVSDDVTDYKEKMNEVEKGLKTVHEALDPKNIINPIKANVDSAIGKRNRLDYALPIIISFIIMLTALLLGVTVRMKEKKSYATKRNVIFSSTASIFFGDFLFVLMLILVELFVILLGFNLLFGANTFYNFHYIFFMSILYSSMWILIGCIIGDLFNSQEGSMFTAISLGLVIFLMSDVIVPLEAFPIFLKEVTIFNPYFVFTEILRVNYLALETMYLNSSQIVLMFGLPLVLLLVTYLVHKNLGDKDV
ncbi:ABC transporter permease [Candidatus Woesearchaeota archaeon]|nr:ABC transporter permease [Candidatus Woesearchaeota archaeon]MCF7901123.1 ABC transporter permease [Candidatus Woesearchaeota archaeon]MCF8012888.1 ABC transporter permease [Candidatus Woesearchaeota archaeon]